MLKTLQLHFKTAEQELRSKSMLLVVLSFAVVIAVYWNTMFAMASIWLRSDTFAHGLIVTPMVLYLIFRERHVLRALRPEPFWPGLLFVLGGSLLWMAGGYLGVNALEQFAAVALIPATILTLGGPIVLRAVGFPMVFLLFAVPFGEFLIPHLMEITADLTTVLLVITGFPVYRDGLFLAVPGGDFEIAKACSGIRYLIASVVLGTIFGYLTFNSWRKRLVFMVFSFLVPIFANGIRAYLIVVLASVSGMRLAVGVDHLIYGWVFFGIVMFVLFGVGMRFRDDHIASFVMPPTPTGPKRPVRVLLILATVAMLSGPLLLHLAKARTASAAQVSLAQPPVGWRTTEFDVPWSPSFLPSDQSLRRAISDGQLTIYEYVDVYHTAVGGVDAASSSNRLVNKKTSSIQQQLTESTKNMRLLLIASDNKAFYVATWYQNGLARSASPLSAKLAEAWNTLVLGGGTSAIVVFAVEAKEENLAKLIQFLAIYHPALSECLANPGQNTGCDG